MATFPVLVLTGPRQVGKTTLLEKTFPHFNYVSLDLASVAEFAETRSREFLEQYPPPLLIDEVQYAPQLFRSIKAAVDGAQGERGQYILTGSQSFTLMNAVSDSLAGRAGIVPFLGLSASEWAEAQRGGEGFDWREFVWRGSFPALWGAEPVPSPRRWYPSYMATYLERDVRNLLRVGSLRDFERFLRATAMRVGQTLNMSELGRDVGISSTTAREWTSVLQASNQIYLLEPYHRSLGKRLAKQPKIYFTDTGLAAFLMGFQSARSMWQSPSIGALWENHVVTQWLRWRDWHCQTAALWYWRNQSGDEVDLVVESDGRLLPVECKVAERPSGRASRGVRKMRQLYGGQVRRRALVACTTPSPFELPDQTVAVPGWMMPGQWVS